MVEIGIDPVILRLGAFELAWHGLWVAAAVAVALWLGTRRAEAAGISGEAVTGVAVWAVLGGIVGARLLHVLDHPSDFMASPAKVFAVWQGGVAAYGGFLGGITGGFIAARRARLPAWPLLDAAAPAMLVGQAIGRVGCFINGDAWGEPTGGGWGVVYVSQDALLPAALHGVPTHPYPVYEIAAVLALLGALWLWRRHASPAGATFLAAAAGYAAIRFGLTFFRQEEVIALGLQEAQIVAVITGAIALSLLLMRRRGTGASGAVRASAAPARPEAGPARGAGRRASRNSPPRG